MHIYCSVCKKHTDNVCPKKLKGKSICAKCLTIRSFSDKINNKY